MSPRISAAMLVAILATGCTSLVTAPRAPREPTSVFILREARHIGVVLPDESASGVTRYVEYGFGDWAWYALGEDSWYDAFPTVLWPTPGALCRREYAAHSPAELRRSATWVALDEIAIGRAEAGALRQHLEAVFERESARAVFQPDYGMTFVPYAESYWFGNTCADVAGEWMRELGCDVSWAPIRLSLAAPGATAPR